MAWPSECGVAVKPLGSRILIACALAAALVVVRVHLAAQHGPRPALWGLAEAAANAHPANSYASSGRDQAQLARITIDYPEEGSIFPPDITPPTFISKHASPTARAWQVDVMFSNGSAAIPLKAPGQRDGSANPLLGHVPAVHHHDRRGSAP